MKKLRPVACPAAPAPPYLFLLIPSAHPTFNLSTFLPCPHNGPHLPNLLEALAPNLSLLFSRLLLARWEQMQAMSEPPCIATAHETPFGPVIQYDGELVLSNPFLTSRAGTRVIRKNLCFDLFSGVRFDSCEWKSGAKLSSEGAYFSGALARPSSWLHVNYLPSFANSYSSFKLILTLSSKQLHSLPRDGQ
jgi:hypothetical protein